MLPAACSVLSILVQGFGLRYESRLRGMGLMLLLLTSKPMLSATRGLQLGQVQASQALQ